jgi:hypothetical protein
MVPKDIAMARVVRCSYMGRTITLPQELYERLQQEALRSKVSVESLVRKRLEGRPKAGRGRVPKVDPILAIAGTCHSKGELASKNIDKHLYGI